MGREICSRLAEQGNAVAVLDVQWEAADTAARELAASGVPAAAFHVDVAEQDSVRSALAAVRQELGAISILVASAGIAPYDAAVDISIEQWCRVIGINLTGAFLCIQGVIPEMVEAGWGRIVTVSSAAGQSGTARMAHYSAAKGGLIALTKSLARELGSSGVTVNSVAPGLIDTPMSRQAQASGNVPPDDAIARQLTLGRKGAPGEVAALCAFLCNDDAAYITGQVYGVNGGMVI